MTKVELLEYTERLLTEKARRDVRTFSERIYPDIDNQWFHRTVYQYLNKWVTRETPKLAIFMPPQHGKSTMSSIVVPPFILGHEPDAKIVCASYNGSVSSKFNRAVQDVMTSREYKRIFPHVEIPESGNDRGNELRNSQYFETLNYKGFYKAVGVGGALTSETVDFGIIDDPIKDRKEANSKTYRNNLWDWYTDVWSTRLNNQSCELMLFTRWHEDDLAGRLFDPKNPHYDKARAEQWVVIVLPALKEKAPPPIQQAININDPRSEGDALWESKHSREKHLLDQRTNPYTFASLKQQRPNPLEGGIIKREQFEIMPEAAVPFNPEKVPVNFVIDGAFTDKTTNDPTAQMAYRVHGGKLYIYNCIPIYKNLDQYLKFIRGYFDSSGYGMGSIARVEYKASGPGIISMLRLPEYGGYNVSRINDTHVAMGKITRVEMISPALASGKVVLIQGGWNAAFIDQCANFPNDTHDDMVDCLSYAVLQEITPTTHTVYKSTVNLNLKSRL